MDHSTHARPLLDRPPGRLDRQKAEIRALKAERRDLVDYLLAVEESVSGRIKIGDAHIAGLLVEVAALRKELGHG